MRILQALALGGLAVAMTVGPAAAQDGTGSVAGRLVFCKQLPRPVGDAGNADPDVGASMDAAVDASIAADPNTSIDADADTGAPDLADVTPGVRRFRTPGFLTLPAPGVDVKVVGLSLSARTDANGQFVLQGVPAAQPLTVAASLASTPSLTLQMQNVVVSPGQTIDLGTMGLSGCGATVPNPSASDQGVTVVVQVDNPAPAGGSSQGTDSDVPTGGASQGSGTDVPTPGHNLPAAPAPVPHVVRATD